MNRKSYILLLLSTLYGLFTYSQTIEFIENKGQWDDRVRFMGEVSNGAFFIHRDGFTVVQHNPKDWEMIHDVTHNRSLRSKLGSDALLTLRSHAYRVDFVDANGKSRIVTDKPLITYNNYFIGNDPAKWASECRIYQGITIKDIYPNIDLRYYTDNGLLKYDLIVNPGGNVADIQLKYQGVNNLQVKNRELIIGTSIGELKESAPYTYQYNEKGKTQVAARYLVRDKLVRFEVKKL